MPFLQDLFFHFENQPPTTTCLVGVTILPRPFNAFTATCWVNRNGKKQRIAWMKQVKEPLLSDGLSNVQNGHYSLQLKQIKVHTTFFGTKKWKFIAFLRILGNFWRFMNLWLIRRTRRTIKMNAFPLPKALNLPRSSFLRDSYTRGRKSNHPISKVLQWLAWWWGAWAEQGWSYILLCWGRSLYTPWL